MNRVSLPITLIQTQKVPSFTTNNQLKQPQQKVQIDSDVVGLVAKDIKASFEDIIGMKQLKDVLY